MKNKKQSRRQNKHKSDTSLRLSQVYIALISSDDFGERPEDFSLAETLSEKICRAEPAKRQEANGI